MMMMMMKWGLCDSLEGREGDVELFFYFFFNDSILKKLRDLITLPNWCVELKGTITQ